MNERLRRIILFATIVITGSVLILFDIPLILMIPLVLVVGFITLLLLGAITVSEIKSSLSRIKPGNLKKVAHPDKKPPSPQKPGEMKKSGIQKAGIVSHIRSFISSIGSLGTVLKERSKQEKKVGDINKLLDKTVSEKVRGPALSSTGTGVSPKPPSPGSSGGPGLQDQDPFLSLSEDEFDASLLDGLDDLETTPLQSSSVPVTSSDVPGSKPGPDINEPDITMPVPDISPDTGDLLMDNAEGLEEFSGLEGGEPAGQDFGDLDTMSLDDVDLDIDMDEVTAATPAKSSSPGEPPQAFSPAVPQGPAVKTAWIPSGGPAADEGITDDQFSTQSDMAKFSGGASTSDEDMLSSLASDIKRVTKETDVSLVRDLKDFKAPATDIEGELNDMYGKMKAVKNPEKKGVPRAKGMK